MTGDWDYSARKRDGLLVQESEDNPFRWIRTYECWMEGICVAPGRVVIKKPDWPVLALDGDRYVLLYDPPPNNPKRGD